jgi:hypothetical protein
VTLTVFMLAVSTGNWPLMVPMVIIRMRKVFMII